MDNNNINISSPRDLRQILHEYNLYPRKKWGQNFLVDNNIVNKILKEINPENHDHIIEIGPGLGALTLPMVQKNAFVSAFEIDRGFVLFLEELLAPYKNRAVIEVDVRRIDIGEYCANLSSVKGFKGIKIVGNLPYYITSPFIYEIISKNIFWEKSVLMIQKEMAGRLIADTGSSLYGALSVLCRAFTKTRVAFKVSPNVFYPVPRVDSAVVVMEPVAHSFGLKEKDFFIRLVSGLFIHRRKTLLNSLCLCFEGERLFFSKILSDANIAENDRPESLDCRKFANLSLLLYNNNVKIRF